MDTLLIITRIRIIGIKRLGDKLYRYRYGLRSVLRIILKIFWSLKEESQLVFGFYSFCYKQKGSDYYRESNVGRHYFQFVDGYC